MNEDEDFGVRLIAGIVYLKVPYRTQARGARWCEFGISTETALRLQEELANAIRHSEGFLERVFG